MKRLFNDPDFEYWRKKYIFGVPGIEMKGHMYEMSICSTKGHITVSKYDYFGSSEHNSGNSDVPKPEELLRNQTIRAGGFNRTATNKNENDDSFHVLCQCGARIRHHELDKTPIGFENNQDIAVINIMCFFVCFLCVFLLFQLYGCHNK